MYCYCHSLSHAQLLDQWRAARIFRLDKDCDIVTLNYLRAIFGVIFVFSWTTHFHLLIAASPKTQS